MLSADFVLFIALLYVAVLFAVAFLGDRRARSGRLGLLQSPLVYTLSISIYCTSWTFYGAVGSAARNGLEFLTIYLGPTLVFVGWWMILRKLVRIGHTHGITSIADMISSRYGKSAALAAVVTLIAVITTTPYIALQLKAVTTSFDVIDNASPDPLSGLPRALPDYTLGFWIAFGMAVFAILFGTRNIDAKERHHGVVAAIALEAIVKLVALLAVGALVVFGILDGPGSIFTFAPPALTQERDERRGRHDQRRHEREQAQHMERTRLRSGERGFEVRELVGAAPVSRELVVRDVEREKTNRVRGHPEKSERVLVAAR